MRALTACIPLLRIVLPALVLLGLAGPGAAAAAPAAEVAPAGVVQAGFAAYWAAHDGALLFGAPISDLIEQPNLTVQYYERARFEWHSDWPAGRQITLGRLGADLLAGRALPGVAAFPSNP